MTHEVKEWQGKPILAIKKDETAKWAFTFGLAKAKLIVQHFREIEDFVRDEELKKSQQKVELE